VTDVVYHDYVSTACVHDRHERCRQFCKFCGVKCRCACHTTTTSSRIVDVVSARIGLRRVGRRYQAPCPFHDDSPTSPSLSVDPSTGLYYCFGCGAGGDADGFIARFEKR
jgi:CHC2 zinc finger